MSRKKNINQKSGLELPSSQKYKYRNTITLLTIIGTLLIFASWFIENYLEKQWQSKIDEYELTMDRFRFFKTIEYVHRDHNDILTHFYLKDTTDEFINSQLCEGLTNLTIMKLWQRWTSSQLMTIKMDDQERKEILDLEKSYILNKERILYDLNNKKNFLVLTNYIDPIIKEAYDLNMSMESDVNAGIEMYTERREFSDKVFLSFYILGSVILGFAYIIHRRNE